MRWTALILVVALAGCGCQDDGGGDGGGAAAAFPAAQEIVDGIAAGHADLTRLTLHAVPSGKTTCTQLASTMAERRGKPSDPEDLEALRSGQEVVLDEDGAVDVTVPILVVDGKPTAVAGVTVKLAEGGDRAAAIDEARAIARELESEVQAADEPVW